MKKRELDTYSGPFDPKWKYENLTKEALIRLLNEQGIKAWDFHNVSGLKFKAIKRVV